MIASDWVASGRTRVMRRMRWLLCGLVMLGAGEASAADLGDSLRGATTWISSPNVSRWDGFYFGGQVGAVASGADFSKATQSLIEQLLAQTTIQAEAPVSQWPVLGKADTTGSSFGGFVGYSTQWDGAVVGIEANYNRTDLSLSSTDSMRRTFSVSTGNNDIQVDANASTHVTDYGSLRVRGGWAMGNFLPYATLGLAVGRADVVRNVTVTGRDPITGAQLFQLSANGSKTGDFAYGYS